MKFERHTKKAALRQRNLDNERIKQHDPRERCCRNAKRRAACFDPLWNKDRGREVSNLSETREIRSEKQVMNCGQAHSNRPRTSAASSREHGEA